MSVGGTVGGQGSLRLLCSDVEVDVLLAIRGLGIDLVDVLPRERNERRVSDRCNIGVLSRRDRRGRDDRRMPLPAQAAASPETD